MTESVVGTSRPAFAGNAGALGMPAGPPPVRPIRYVVSPGTGTGGRVTGYRVGSDGSLVEITSAPAAVGITGAAAA